MRHPASPLRALCLCALMIATPAFAQSAPWNRANNGALDGMIAQHAAANGVPLELARRVVARESGGNARAVSKGNYGLMQIRLGTARAMGYSGDAAGLLDPNTNMTYAMKYLAGAYHVAGGNHDRAVRNYAAGYYFEAKRRGFSPYTGAPLGAPAFGPAADARADRARFDVADAYAFVPRGRRAQMRDPGFATRDERYQGFDASLPGGGHR